MKCDACGKKVGNEAQMKIHKEIFCGKPTQAPRADPDKTPDLYPGFPWF